MPRAPTKCKTLSDDFAAAQLKPFI